MTPKPPLYKSPLLAILRGGKSAVLPPKPVQFGLPQAGAPLPQTANTTRQLVTPAPFVPPQPAPAPINPLDIIRQGKEQAIKQGNFKAPINDPTGLFAGTGRAEQPAINEKIAQTISRAVREKGLLPAAGEFLFGEFGKLTSPNPEQYTKMWIEDRDTLLQSGILLERAEQVATQNIFNQTKMRGMSMTGGKTVPQVDLGVDLTPEEKGALRASNAMRELFAVLDAPVVAGVSKPIKFGSKLFLKPVRYTEDMRRIVNDYAEVANKTSPAGDIEQAEIRAAAQSLADKLVNEGYLDNELRFKKDKQMADLLYRHMDDSRGILDTLVDDAPGLKVPKEEAPKTPAEAKASGQSFDEWVKGQEVSKEQMLKRGADGYLNKAYETEIPLSKIEGREPTPAMEGGYKKGTEIKQPIEVQYQPENDVYILYAGNHRVTQAEINGQRTIKAFVEDSSGKTRSQLKAEWDNATPPPKKSILQTAKDNLRNPAMRQGGYAGNVPEGIKKTTETTYSRKVNDLISSYAEGESKIEELNTLQSTINAQENLKEFKKIQSEIDAYEKGNQYAVKQLADELELDDYSVIEGLSAYIDIGKRRGGKTVEDFYKFLPKKTTPPTKSVANVADITPTPPAKSPLQVVTEVKPQAQDPLKTIAKSQVDSQDVSLANRITPIDRLIAENKVRVVSRDGRDVYQVKKGNEWRNVRDEDSAVKQASPKPKSPLATVTKQKVVRSDKQYKATPEQLEKYEYNLTQISGAEAGERIARFSEYGTLEGYTAKRSTFPSYIDDDLKSRKLFDRYLEGRDGTENDFSIVYPKGSKLARLDEQVKQNAGIKEVKVRQMYRSRDVERFEREATDMKIREERLAKLKEKTVGPEKAVDQVREIQKVAPERVRSLEEVAQQLDEVLDLPPKMRAEPLTKIVTQTPVTKKVNLLDYIRTPDRVLEKIGFGKEARLLRQQYEKYVIELPKNIETISGWVKRVPKESNERIFDYLDGVDVKLTPKEQAVADEIREYLKTWADRLDLPEDNRVTNYITRLFEDSLIQKEFDEDLAKIISEKIPGQVYDPFLEKRLGAKGYKRDTWGALDAYTKRATRKVHMDVALERIREKAGSSLDFTNLEESQFRYIQNYIDRVQMRPTYVDNLIDNGVKAMVGYRFGQRPVAYVSQLLRRMTYRGMLGANIGSALRNLSQGVNTYATLGEKYTAIGYAKLFNTNARKELAEQGVLAQNFIEDRALSSTKKALQKADKAIWYMFDQAEKINRGAAYFGAKAKGLNKGMSEAEAVEYAKSIVRKTQFAYDLVDAPVAMAGDLVKTLTQFQTFTVKQTEFLVEMLKDKNFLGLMRYAIGGYVFVNTVGQAMGMEEKELLPYLRFDVPPSLKFPTEVGKSVLNVPDQYGNVPDTEKKLSNIGKSFLGLVPGGIQMKKTYEGTKMLEEGGAYDKAGRQMFEQTDTTAGKVQSVLFGKYASPQAKEYFNKEKSTGNKELDTFIKEEKEVKAETTETVSQEAKRLSKLDMDSMISEIEKIATTDEVLAEKILDKILADEIRATWSKEEEALSKLTNDAKSRYLIKKIDSMTTEEAVVYLEDLQEREIISEKVLDTIFAE